MRFLQRDILPGTKFCCRTTLSCVSRRNRVRAARGLPCVCNCLHHAALKWTRFGKLRASGEGRWWPEQSTGAAWMPCQGVPAKAAGCSSAGGPQPQVGVSSLLVVTIGGGFGATLSGRWHCNWSVEVPKCRVFSGRYGPSWCGLRGSIKTWRVAATPSPPQPKDPWDHFAVVCKLTKHVFGFREDENFLAQARLPCPIQCDGRVRGPNLVLRPLPLSCSCARAHLTSTLQSSAKTDSCNS